MNGLITLEDGEFLVQLARRTIETYVREQKIVDLPETDSKSLHEPRSVFVTIKKHNPEVHGNMELRGCIGRLQPRPGDMDSPVSLLEVTRQAALSSAVEDPRFAPVRIDELNSILIEVSILTVPMEIIATDKTLLPQIITIGKDGIIVEFDNWRRGLLLPQVAPEQGWNATQFLQGCCQKAGLPADKYLDNRVKVYKFQAQIFTEITVGGKIEERFF